MAELDAREIYELRQLCLSAQLSQDALGNLIDARLSVPTLVRSEAAAMAAAKKAGLGMEERHLLRDALRRHKDEVLSAVEPRIVEIDEDDAEALHVVAAQQQLAALRSIKRAELAEQAKGEEVIRNGAVCDRYRWTQELGEITVAVDLPPGTSKQEVVCKVIGPAPRHTIASRRPTPYLLERYTHVSHSGIQVTVGTILCGVRGEPPVIDGKLHAIVRADEAMWQLQDSHRLVITVPKLQIERPTWWPCLIVGDPEINTDR